MRQSGFSSPANDSVTFIYSSKLGYMCFQAHQRKKKVDIETNHKEAVKNELCYNKQGRVNK